MGNLFGNRKRNDKSMIPLYASQAYHISKLLALKSLHHPGKSRLRLIRIISRKDAGTQSDLLIFPLRPGVFARKI